MNRSIWPILGLILVSESVVAFGKTDVRDLILREYPGANITEIERETYRGQKIFEVDFQHEGQDLEAIISLDGEIIKVGIDD